jgi:acetyl esterase/lipase
MSQKTVVAVFALMLTASVSSATSLVWTGAVDNHWANAGNWNPAQVPATGDDLEFTGAPPPPTMVNDLPAGTVISEIDSYNQVSTVTGSTVQVCCKISGTSFTYSADVEADGVLDVAYTTFGGSFNVNGQSVTTLSVIFNGPITGNGTLYVDQSTINGAASSFNGQINLNHLGLIVNGTVGAPMYGPQNTQLNGTGVAGPVSGYIRLEPASSPYAFSPSTLTTGNLELDGTGGTQAQNGVLSVEISSATSYGKVKVNGTVTLRSPSLAVAVANGFRPAPGQAFTIIDNDGSDPVSGIFVNQSRQIVEGTTFLVDGIAFSISYRGGDGNDVVLTVAPQPTLALTQSKSSTVYGEPFTVDVTASGSSGTPTGQVQFDFGGLAAQPILPLINGHSSYTLSDFANSPSGPFHAHYLGDATYGPADSAPLTHFVAKSDSSFTLSAQTSPTSNRIGMTAAFAPVAPSTKTPFLGRVDFYVDNVIAASQAFDYRNNTSTQVVAGANVTPGPHTLSANFIDTSNLFNNSSAGTTFNFRYGSATTATTQSMNASLPAVINVTVSSAAPGAGVPTGSVAIMNGATPIGSGTLTNGAVTITTSPLPAGMQTLTLSYSGDTTFQPSSTTLTVNALQVRILASDDSVLERSGTTTVSLRVSLSTQSSATVTVDYSTSDGTATAASDYMAASGTLSFAPGETWKTIPLSIAGGAAPGPDKRFFITLSNAHNAELATTRVTITILNPNLAFNTMSDLEFANVNGTSLRLDLFTPLSGNGPFPLIVGIDASDWSSPQQHASVITREATRGYAVALVTFRAPGIAAWPAQIDDVKAAVRWLRANAARFNLGPNRVGVWGVGTAGGHLAALLGTSGGIAAFDDPALGNPTFSSRVNAVADWYGATDLLALANDPTVCSPTVAQLTQLLGCGPASCPDTARTASPVTYASPDNASLLAIYGTVDCNVPQAQGSALVDQLSRAGVAAMLELNQGAGHAGTGWADNAAILQAVDDFFDRIVKVPPRHRATVH